MSASQDVVIDAYRTDLLPARERGLGSSLNVMGYRLAMILSGGIALIWTDPDAGRRLGLADGLPLHGRADVRRGRALGHGAAQGGDARRSRPRAARNDVHRLPGGAGGGGGRLSASATGSAPPIAHALLGPLLEGSALSATLKTRWENLLALLLGIGFTLPLAAWAARKARFETLLGGLSQLLQPARRGGLPGLHRAVQAGRRLRRLADDALPAEEHGLQPGRGGRGQQDHRPVADHRRRAARRAADAAAGAVALAAAVRRPADGQQPGLLVAGGQRQGR